MNRGNDGSYGAPESTLTWDLQLPGGRTIRIGARPLIQGIINCTPDSFSDGGTYARPEDAIRAGLEMLQGGADWLDVGGESTRPGARPVPPSEQLERILPVLEGLRRETIAPISVDTMSPEVGLRALEAGADIINDVGASRDPGWKEVLRAWRVPVILVHMRGSPLDMQVNVDYPHGVTRTVLEFFKERLETLSGWGIEPGRTILDPGIGFGKRLQDNLELIRNIEALRALHRPLLIGASRKGFLQKVIGGDLDSRDLGTVIINSEALFRGANILRVHNVPHASALVKLFLAVRGGPLPLSGPGV
jgi:dihydropteroate synthase